MLFNVVLPLVAFVLLVAPLTSAADTELSQLLQTQAKANADYHKAVSVARSKNVTAQVKKNQYELAHKQELYFKNLAEKAEWAYGNATFDAETASNDLALKESTLNTVKDAIKAVKLQMENAKLKKAADAKAKVAKTAAATSTLATTTTLATPTLAAVVVQNPAQPVAAVAMDGLNSVANAAAKAAVDTGNAVAAAAAPAQANTAAVVVPTQ